MSFALADRFRPHLSPCLLGAALCLPLPGHAADDDSINPDRPNVANSSQVVGKGRLQLETGLLWERQRSDDVHERSLSTPTLLRIGVGESTELRIETEGRSIVHDSDPHSGEHATTAGYADLALGAKWHLGEQDGARPSLGLLLETLLPSGSKALRGHGLRPSLLLPAEWDLGGDYALGVMPGVGVDSDDRGSRYGYGVLAASLGKDFGRGLHGFAEIAAPQIARASAGGTQASVDAGVTYLVNKDCQLDAMLVHGLNHRTPDLSLGFGLSIRR